MKILISTFITILLSVNIAGNGYANITFSVSFRQVEMPNPNLTKINPVNEKTDTDDRKRIRESESLQNVEIGEHFFSYENKKTKYIYDFNDNKIVTINSIDKTFVEDSLFAALILKLHEFRSSLMLGSVFAAGAPTSSFMSHTLNEHLFSLEHPKSDSEVTTESASGSMHFSWEGNDLLSYSRQGVEVSPEEKEMFTKFFRYVYRGHPYILERLSANNIIPHSINITHYHTSITQRELRINSVETIPSGPYSLAGYLPAELSEKRNPDLRFLYEIKTSEDMNLKEHLEWLSLRIDQEFSKGNYLDTFLFYLEYILCSGLQFPPSFQEHSQKMKEDENVANLQAVISNINREITEDLLLQLEELEVHATFQKHVIKIFQANTQTGLGNTAQARELFLEVLDNDPYITGVYMDLGKIYYSEQNPGLAWLCWDIARKIAPAHKVISEIESFESQLIENYPEYF